MASNPWKFSQDWRTKLLPRHLSCYIRVEQWMQLRSASRLRVKLDLHSHQMHSSAQKTPIREGLLHERAYNVKKNDEATIHVIRHRQERTR